MATLERSAKELEHLADKARHKAYAYWAGSVSSSVFTVLCTKEALQNFASNDFVEKSVGSAAVFGILGGTISALGFLQSARDELNWSKAYSQDKKVARATEETMYEDQINQHASELVSGPVEHIDCDKRPITPRHVRTLSELEALELQHLDAIVTRNIAPRHAITESDLEFQESAHLASLMSQRTAQL